MEILGRESYPHTCHRHKTNLLIDGGEIMAGTMNAANITHGLKLAGGNTRMWVGVLVIALVLAIAFEWLSVEENRQRLECGLFS